MAKDTVKDQLVKWIWQAETQLDEWLREARQRIDPIEHVALQAYRGYGTPEVAHLRARVLEDRNIQRADERHTALDNIQATIKQVATREIPEVEVHAEFAGQHLRTQSDEEGYVQFRFDAPQTGDSHKAWWPVRLYTDGTVADSDAPAEAETEILIPPPSARFGVISDIDDTIVQTGATSTFQKTKVTLLRNAHSRVPFEGIAPFYTALQDGVEDEEFNPIFYLSSSPWNLYDLFSRFMEVHGLPAGPIILKDLGIEKTHLFKSSHGDHKRGYIEQLFETYPHLSFILVGDSGQKDPDIYQAISREFPDRVRAIYIRDVTDPTRDREVQAICEEVRGRGIDMLLVDDTLEAAEHAAAQGWIRPGAVEEVRRQRDKDRQESA